MKATRVHLDHNATTPLRAEARARFLEVAHELSGNPSSLHASGRRARSIVDEARERIAAALAVKEDEIFFTSGGTEANNLALMGTLRAAGPAAGLVTSAIEHSSVLGPAQVLADEGRPVFLIGVDSGGALDAEALRAAAESIEAGVVSVAAANNEIGALAALPEVAECLERAGAGSVWLHTDAVQALGKAPLRLQDWQLDLASLSAHKVGGPPGVGVLWRRSGVALEPLLHGGGQEGGLRPGTENVAGIAAAAVAIELAVREQVEFSRRASELASYLWNELHALVPEARLVGPSLEMPRLPNTLCVLLPGTDGRVLVMRLDLEGLEVSAGSACASGSIEPSHVLLALGYDAEEARAGIRISLGRTTTRADCDRAVAVFKKLFASSRAT